jgi:hypothetical protein
MKGNKFLDHLNDYPSDFQEETLGHEISYYLVVSSTVSVTLLQLDCNHEITRNQWTAVEELLHNLSQNGSINNTSLVSFMVMIF